MLDHIKQIKQPNFGFGASSIKQHKVHFHYNCDIHVEADLHEEQKE